MSLRAIHPVVVLLLLAALPLRADLISHWKLDETSGSVLDAVGGDHGTNNGATRGVTGVIGNAYTFTAADSDHISGLSLDSILNATGTLSVWIKTTQTSGSGDFWQSPGITGVEEFGGGNDIFWGFIDNTGRIGLKAGDGGEVRSSGAINDDAWHHVVMTRNHSSGAIALYVDGNLQGSTTSDTGVKTTGFDSLGRIGDTGGTPEYYDGSLDDVAIWDNVLTANQARALYSLGSSTVLNYHASRVQSLFDVHDDAAGSIIIDGRKWAYTTGLSGTEGAISTASSGDFELRLTSGGAGLMTVDQGWLVQDVKKSSGEILNPTDAINLLNGLSAASSQTRTQIAVIDYHDPDGSHAGNYSVNNPFPNGTGGVNEDDFAVRAKATIRIPAGSLTHTFAISNDDYVQLIIERGGSAVSVATQDSCCSDLIHTVTFPEAGDYNIYVVMGERGGDSGLEISSAPGTHASWNSTDFDLVGDTANGGLALVTFKELTTDIRMFAVRQVFSSTTISNLAQMDALLSGTNATSQTNANYETINFHSSGGGAGHFGDNGAEGVAFPGGAGDNFALEIFTILALDANAAGWWTFGVNSDDGFRLWLEDSGGVVAFDSGAGHVDGSGEYLDGSGRLKFDGGRSTDTTLGRIQLAEGTYNLYLQYFENGGNESLELFYARGVHGSFNGSFELLHSIPVPAPLAMGLLGLAAVAGLSRRRQNRQA